MTTTRQFLLLASVQCLLLVQALTAQTHDCVPTPTPPPGQPDRAVPSIIFNQNADPTDLSGPFTGMPATPFVHANYASPKRPYPMLPPNDPVDYISGNFQHTETDLSFQLFGRSFQFQRYYNSKSSLPNGAFGPKWTHNFSIHLVEHLDKSVILETGYGGYLFSPGKDSSYQAPAGMYYELVRFTGGSYQLTKPNREVLLFNAYGQLESIADRFGNAIRLEYRSSGDLTRILFPEDLQIDLFYGEEGQISMLKGPNNQWVQYCYDEQGRLQEHTDVRGLSTRYTYDRDHYLTSMELPNGHVYQYDFHWDGKLLSSTDPFGKTETFKYPNVMGLFPVHKTIFKDKNGFNWKIHYQNGKVEKVTDPNGKITRYKYGKKSHLIETIEQADGSSLTFKYDELGRLLEKMDGLGQRSVYTYDEATGMLKTIGTGALRLWEFRYDTEGYLRTVVDPSGLRTHYFCNSKNLPDSIRNPFKQLTEFSYASGGAAMAVVKGESLNHYTFDEQGRLIAHQSPTFGVTRYQFDGFGMLSRIAYPNGINWQYHYRTDGQPRALSNNKGQVYCFQYDRMNRLATFSDPLGQTQTFSYDGKGNLKQVTDASGNTREYQYDPYQRLNMVVDANGEKTHYTYNALGNLTTVRTPNDAVTRYQFDSEGQLTKISNPTGFNTYFSYNSQGRVIAKKDPMGHKTLFGYDQTGKLINVVSPNGYETVFSYDALGNLRKVTNATGQDHRFKYNENGYLTGESDPLGNWHRYQYDEEGRLIMERTRRGDTIRYQYNEIGKLVAREFSGSKETFSYAPSTQLASTGNHVISYQYTYDAAGRLITKEIPEWGITIRYGYDAYGNRTKLELPDAKVQFWYDNNHRLEAVDDPVAGMTSFLYDQSGRLNMQCNENGIYTTYYHYDSDLLQGLHNRKSSGEPMDIFQYFYDQTGNFLAITKDGDLYRSFGYDQEGRLIEAVSPEEHTETFKYDSLGNRIAWTIDDKTRHYSYDDGGRLLKTDSIAYEHDENGNLALIMGHRDTSALIFDAVGNLTEIQSNGEMVYQYAYDPYGRRISRVDSAGNIIRYLYDGDQLIAELDSLNNIQRRFNYYNEMDALVQIVQDTQAYYVHRDAFGNVLSISDREEQLINVYDYGAFGNLTDKEETISHNLLFQGREQEPMTGFYYFRHRFYQPEWGRFLSQDPFEGYPNMPLSLNKYIYAYNNPMSYRDPSGTDPTGQFQIFDLSMDQADLINGMIPTVQNPMQWVRQYTNFQTSGTMPAVRRPFRNNRDKIGNSFQGY